VFELSTRKERRIVEGRDPSLSPDGDAIAFTSDLSSHATTIRVIDLKTKKIRSFASLDQHNAFDAQWSADGTKLAFNVQSDKRDGIGVLNVLDGQWKSITKDLDLGLKGSGVFLDSWVGSDNAVLCHDLDFVYEVRVDGTLLQKLPIERLFDKGQTSGRTRYSFSSEKTYLLFDAMEDPTKGWIYIVDLSKQRVSRISPNTIFAEEPMWLPSEKEILFTCFYKSNPSIGNICKIRTDGTGLIILVRNARSASYSVK
jgi:Tol biopolymer transport system component